MRRNVSRLVPGLALVALIGLAEERLLRGSDEGNSKCCSEFFGNTQCTGGCAGFTGTHPTTGAMITFYLNLPAGNSINKCITSPPGYFQCDDVRRECFAPIGTFLAYKNANCMGDDWGFSLKDPKVNDTFCIPNNPDSTCD